MDQSQVESQHPVVLCPEHAVRMRAMVRPGWYRCKRCKAIWFWPMEISLDQEVRDAVPSAPEPVTER